MGINRDTPKSIIKLKRVIIRHKSLAILMILWAYSIMVYFLQLANILMFRGLSVIVLLGVPIMFAIVGTIELFVQRLTK